VLWSILNGREVNRVEADRIIVRHPGLHANGTDIRFRNIVLTPLKSGATPAPHARRVDPSDDRDRGGR
jgi:hypothetical protein